MYLLSTKSLYVNVKNLQQCLWRKIQYLSNNNMCFGCLRVGHVSKNFRRRATCNICRWSHPSPLHKECLQGKGPEAPPQEESASTVLCSVSKTNSDHTSMIVLVWLSCASKNSQETLLYALLYTQSSNTFIDQDVFERVQAGTEPEQWQTGAGQSELSKSGWRIPFKRVHQATPNVNSRVHSTEAKPYSHSRNSERLDPHSLRSRRDTRYVELSCRTPNWLRLCNGPETITSDIRGRLQSIYSPDWFRLEYSGIHNTSYKEM